MLLQHSTLANELRRLYHSLVGGHSVVLSINQVLDLNVRLVSKADAVPPAEPECQESTRGLYFL